MLVEVKVRLLCCCVGKYFDEISTDSGRYCFGVEDTLKALEQLGQAARERARPFS